MAQSPDWPDLPYVQAKSYGKGRDGKKPTYSVIHYTAGSERSTAAEDGAAYDARRTDGVSTHYFHDQNSTIQCVRLADRANAAFHKGNRLGIQHELCGTVQTRAQWLDAASYPTLQRAAYQVARDHHKFGIPVRRLTVAQVRACWYEGAPGGICGHVDVTYAYPEDGGTHTDPGTEFPWDVFMDLVQTYYEEGDMSQVTNEVWNDRPAQITSGLDRPAGQSQQDVWVAVHKGQMLAKIDELVARPAAVPPPADLAAQIAAELAGNEAFLDAIAQRTADVQAARLTD